MSGNTRPTLAGFQWFVASIMQIDPLNCPPTAPVVAWSLAVALDIVNPALRTACGPSLPGLPTANPYTMAVYNLAGSTLVNLAQDQPQRSFFVELRKELGIAAFTPGVISSTSDNGTSEALLNPDFMKQFTLANLQQIKDPWGRTYLQFAQSYGPTIWDIS